MKFIPVLSMEYMANKTPFLAFLFLNKADNITQQYVKYSIKSTPYNKEISQYSIRISSKIIPNSTLACKRLKHDIYPYRCLHLLKVNIPKFFSTILFHIIQNTFCKQIILFSSIYFIVRRVIFF